MKKEYLISYHWQSKEYGTGFGHTTCCGKIKMCDFDAITKLIQDSLKKEYRDDKEYFSIVILNITKL